jgi:hypothetical protein
VFGPERRAGSRAARRLGSCSDPVTPAYCLGEAAHAAEAHAAAHTQQHVQQHAYQLTSSRAGQLRRAGFNRACVSRLKKACPGVRIDLVGGGKPKSPKCTTQTARVAHRDASSWTASSGESRAVRATARRWMCPGLEVRRGNRRAHQHAPHHTPRAERIPHLSIRCSGAGKCDAHGEGSAMQQITPRCEASS